MPFFRWRLMLSARSESSTALLCIHIAFCSESILAVSAISPVPSKGALIPEWTESSGMESCRRSCSRCLTLMVSSNLLPSPEEGVGVGSGKRKLGSPAITNVMTKSINRMSVFFLTAAKVVIFLEIRSKRDENISFPSPLAAFLLPVYSDEEFFDQGQSGTAERRIMSIMPTASVILTLPSPFTSACCGLKPVIACPRI